MYKYHHIFSVFTGSVDFSSDSAIVFSLLT